MEIIERHFLFEDVDLFGYVFVCNMTSYEYLIS
jgi:hypothetical protein